MNGESIRLWRIARLLTQKELACLAGVSVSVLDAWERGLVKPDKKTRLSVLDILKNNHGNIS